MFESFEMVIHAPHLLGSPEGTEAQIFAYHEGVEISFMGYKGEETLFIPKEKLKRTAMLSESVFYALEVMESEKGRPVIRKRLKLIEVVGDISFPYGTWEMRSLAILRPDGSEIFMLRDGSHVCPVVKAEKKEVSSGRLRSAHGLALDAQTEIWQSGDTRQWGLHKD